jgi:pimeloyl-ACP methyl ester carboxylesterase
MNPTRPAAARIGVREAAARLGGVDTRLVTTEGEGPPILLIHGYADSADTWRAVQSRLADLDRASAAIDLAGMGIAGPFRDDRALLPQWDGMVAEAILELSGRHEGVDVIVAGNSLGGCLSLRAAEDDELPIAGIVPIAPAGLHMARWFPVIESERLIKLIRLSPVPIPEPIVRGMVGRVYRNLAFSHPTVATTEAVESFTSHINSVDRGMHVLDLGRRLLPELVSPFRLERIDCPLLLVWGARDRMVYTTGAERVLRAVDYSDIEVIEDCGHCPQVEDPDRLTDLLARFPDPIDD